MKCYNCKGDTAEVRRGPYRMDFGLDDKVLVQDVEFRYCSVCGEDSISFNRSAGLMDAVSYTVATKQESLTPKEIAFLRKHLNMTQAELARYFSVDAATVSRWENTVNPQRMGGVAERLLRLAMLYFIEHQELPKIDLQSTQPVIPLHLVLSEIDGKWSGERLQPKV